MDTSSPALPPRPEPALLVPTTVPSARQLRHSVRRALPLTSGLARLVTRVTLRVPLARRLPPVLPAPAANISTAPRKSASRVTRPAPRAMVHPSRMAVVW